MARNASSMCVIVPLGIIGGLILIGVIAAAITGHSGGSPGGSIVTTTVVMTATTTEPCTGPVESANGWPLSGCGGRKSGRKRVRRGQDDGFPTRSSLRRKDNSSLLKIVPRVKNPKFESASAAEESATAEVRGVHNDPSQPGAVRSTDYSEGMEDIEVYSDAVWTAAVQDSTHSPKKQESSKSRERPPFGKEVQIQCREKR